MNNTKEKILKNWKNILIFILVIFIIFLILGKKNEVYKNEMVKDGVEISEKILVENLFEGNKTILGEEISYPTKSSAKISSAIITLSPETETGWHLHQSPLFGYIMEGELVVDYGKEGQKIYKEGDAFLEALDFPHNGKNLSSEPVKIFTLYAGSENSQNVIKLENQEEISNSK